ncbi:MAG: hypothetical protein IPK63_16200 [Candidatus Competibacteraceae bacterium]|nr:hypothetical protein [Candidatus Competibacteraceae bacterium]
MATSKRELAIAALATRLGAIRNPYRQDYDEDTFPLKTLIEGEESVLDRAYDDVIISAPIIIEMIDKYSEDADRATVANGLLALLIKTALGDDPTIGGKAEDLQYTGGATVFSETGSQLVGAVANFNLIYRQVLGSPY